MILEILKYVTSIHIISSSVKYVLGDDFLIASLKKINHMIELTTSAFVLLSMFYGTATASVRPVEYNTAPSSIEDRNIVDGVALVATGGNSKTVEAEVREYFEDTPILAEIAKCESSFRHISGGGEIVRGRVNRSDIGVMQINTYYHGEEASKLGINLHTLQGNLAYAKQLYEKEGSAPWSSSSKCWNKYKTISQK